MDAIELRSGIGKDTLIGKRYELYSGIFWFESRLER
jgi:hypothetical protein